MLNVRTGGYIGMGSIYGGTAKFKDNSGNDTILTAANWRNVSDNLTDISVASGPTGRNNMCVAIKSIQIMMTIRFNSAAYFQDISILSPGQAERMSADAPVHFQVILDKQANKAAATAVQIWADNSAGYASQSPKNLDNRKRFTTLHTSKCLLRKKLFLGGHADAGGVTTAVIEGSTVVYKKIFLQFKRPIKVEYDPASTTGGIGA